MKLEKIHKFEQAVVFSLNLDGWNLEWSGNAFEHYDARGYTKYNKECVIEMKFRNKYYETKMLEKYKYDKLMKMDSEIIKLYFVQDTKGNYLFWLNYLDMPQVQKMYCPDTTLWTKRKLLKDVYLLSEQKASIINKND
jgi:hypothetical protein